MGLAVLKSEVSIQTAPEIVNDLFDCTQLRALMIVADAEYNTDTGSCWESSTPSVLKLERA